MVSQIKPRIRPLTKYSFNMNLIRGFIETPCTAKGPKVPAHSSLPFADKRYHPIYFDCDLGRDRAMLTVGLYEMYYKGKSKEEAYKEMKYYGFKDDWTLAGLKQYFEKHLQRPVSQYVPHCPKQPLRNLPQHGEAAPSEGGRERRGIELETIPDFVEPCQ